VWDAARGAGHRTLGVLIVLGLGLTLGACSKCDWPVWQPTRAPQVCQSASPQQ